MKKKELPVTDEQALRMADLCNEETSIDRAMQSAMYSAECRFRQISKLKKEWWDEVLAQADGDNRWSFDSKRKVLYKDYERADINLKAIRR